MLKPFLLPGFGQQGGRELELGSDHGHPEVARGHLALPPAGELPMQAVPTTDPGLLQADQLPLRQG